MGNNKSIQGKWYRQCMVSKAIWVTLLFIILILTLSGCSTKPAAPVTPSPETFPEITTENQAETVQTPVNGTIDLPEILKGKTINITDDGSEWAPYTYYERINGKPTNKLIGFSVDVIQQIFDKNGIPHTLELLPWNRAQEEVKQGDNYQMFLSGSYNEERAHTYYISEPYYSTSGYYFYSKKQYPDGLKIGNLEDLKKYKVAGLLGHNYGGYGFKSDEIEAGAENYSSLVQQLHSGYYDLFPESLEILVGYSAVNTNILADPDLGYARVPNMESVEFYMMFTKNEIGEALKQIVDQGIKEMKDSGELNDLLQKYIP